MYNKYHHLICSRLVSFFCRCL